ncbi:MAG: SRPBCC family protein [Saccharospirillaceae bacterium]|nr:SRPBCC family protein [Pseudomonadales bacterium]NRB80509.1 SRPBCC family protein [Saccharospirillaceae bacterium]
MKLLIFILSSLTVLIGLVCLIGWMLPIKHTASRTLLINAEINAVWLKINNYPAMPQWRNELKKVTELSDGRWQEISKSGDMITFFTTETVPQKRLVRTIVGEKLMFGGSWTFELSRHERATKLKITENGEVYNIVFRFVAKFIMGHHGSMDKYLTQLQDSFK